MRIAATYENGTIFQHFGHTAQFRLYEVADGKATPGDILDTEGSGHGALAGFLAAHQVEALICGGIGAGAVNALTAAGIKLYAGVSGSADEAATALAEGKLQPATVGNCDHHHGEEHTCGHHGCGEHHCGD